MERAGAEDARRSRSDPRVLRSESAIQGALLDQLRSEREFASLTVSEVAAAANVTRKTFYTRFGSLEQVVSRLALDVFQRTAEKVDDDLLRLPQVDNSLSILAFRAYDEHQSVLEPLVRRCPASLFLEPLSEVTAVLVDRMVEINRAPPMDEAEREYLVAALASVMYGLLSVWGRRGFRESPEQVAAFSDRLLAEGLGRVVKGG